MADAAPARPVVSRTRTRTSRRGVPFSLLAALVVLAVALVIGSGVVSGGHETAAQRAAALDNIVRCPSCDDLSVAQSNASAADAVRNEIADMTKSGQSNQQIEAALVAQYGSSILLRPPDSGLSALVWIIPPVGGGIALVAVGVLFWRRSRSLAALREVDT